MGKIGVIGSGTWGTAIAVLLYNNGHEVDLWSAIPAEIEEMQKTHKHKNLHGGSLRICEKHGKTHEGILPRGTDHRGCGKGY